MNPQASIELNLNGYTDLPPGKIAAIVTYLHMSRPAVLPEPKTAAEWSLEPLAGSAARYRALYRAVGEPWLWFSRLAMPDEELISILDDPEVEAYALSDSGVDIGLLELDFRQKGEAELAFLGLVPGVIGQGAGHFLMSEAVRRTFQRPVSRFFVHTCSLDHPAALSFYRRAGFVPYKRAIEIADDPRLLGQLSREAGPHVPVIERG